MAFKSRSIEFCGKPRKFKRCANKELKDYQKKLEQIQDDAIPFTESIRDLQFAIEEKQNEIDGITKSIQLLERLNEPDDEEIRESISLVRNKSKLQKEVNNLRRQFDDKQVENRDIGLELDDKLRECYAEFANKVFDDFPLSDFEEYADSTDYVVAQRLAELYRLSAAGVTQKEMDKAYREIIKDSFR